MQTERLYFSRNSIFLIYIWLAAFLAVSKSSAAAAVYGNRDAENLFEIAFPTPQISVVPEYSYLIRTNNWVPNSINDVFKSYAQWHNHISALQSFRVLPDGTESYWLGVLNDGTSLTNLFSDENTSKIESFSSKLINGWKFASVREKAVFQRDIFHLYYIVINASARLPLTNAVLLERRTSIATALKMLLNSLRLDNKEFESLTNEFNNELALATRQGHFEEQDAFDLSRNYLPLQRALQEKDWYEMKFGAGDNNHFNHYGGRSFVRVFVQSPGWSEAEIFRYWDVMQQYFGTALHTSVVPPLPPKSKFMLLRTFSVLMKDGTIADSHIPEEVLIRAFKTTRSEFDLDSSDYRGTYFYVYKMNRRLLLCDPSTLGLVRHSEDYPSFAGYDSDVPTLGVIRGGGLRTMRQQCIECHSLVRYGSATVFSFEHSKLREPGNDQFSGALLTAIPNRPGRYTFGKANENLGLGK